jgi:phage replication-related protein YjqB (UPF0714/DUF867 family)
MESPYFDGARNYCKHIPSTRFDEQRRNERFFDAVHFISHQTTFNNGI